MTIQTVLPKTKEKHHIFLFIVNCNIRNVNWFILQFLTTSLYKASAKGENSSKTSVIVKGTKSVIDAIDESMITAQVDLSNYNEGEYEVEVKVTGADNKATYTSKTTKIKVVLSKK